MEVWVEVKGPPALYHAVFAKPCPLLSNQITHEDLIEILLITEPCPHHFTQKHVTLLKLTALQLLSNCDFHGDLTMSFMEPAFCNWACFSVFLPQV